VAQVFAATNGFLDRIAVERVDEFLQQLTARLHSEGEEILRRIGEGDWSDETQEGLTKLVSEFADDFGYDLDEEGQPLEQREIGETTREQEGIRGGRDRGDGRGAEEQGAGDDAAETTEEAGALRA
jgi:F-type H+-transporting ATPase subunit alpha